MLLWVLIILGVVAIRMGVEAIRTKLIRYRKSPIDDQGYPLYPENITGKAAVYAGWFCVAVGIALIVVVVLGWMGVLFQA
jgi:hypothetical protein